MRAQVRTSLYSRKPLNFFCRNKPPAPQLASLPVSHAAADAVLYLADAKHVTSPPEPAGLVSRYFSETFTTPSISSTHARVASRAAKTPACVTSGR